MSAMTITLSFAGVGLILFALWAWWVMRWEAREYRDEHDLNRRVRK